MPRLRRMRLVSVGHESARFSDVTLKFTGRDGRAKNSVIWLRNGGGKTSLLSLFFAGVRPNKREFLGQRAEEKVRSIDDYVTKRDHSLVVCEWELDTDKTQLDDDPPLYLSGVFYEWPTSRGESNKPGVDRLFFGTLTSPSVPELTLDDLPIFTHGAEQQHRRTLAGFRRMLNQIDGAHPHQNVFHTDKQHKFEDELASHGIDPEVFYYQVRMNEREGGVSERFSFAEDEEFVDFLLEMAFSQRRAQEVRDQLTTFRQELVERNEQLRPELQYCEGLTARLEKLKGIQRERALVFRETEISQQRLIALHRWVTDRLHELQTQKTTLESEIRASTDGADEARSLADKAQRSAAVFKQHACELRFNAINSEYTTAEQAHISAKRLRNIWSAACPLARSWEARRRAKLLREQLAQKQQQFAPDLEKLKALSTQLANALDHRAGESQRQAQESRRLAEQLTKQADQAQNESQRVLELAVQQEARAESLHGKLATAQSELNLLQESQVLQESEAATNAHQRLTAAIKSLAAEISELDQRILKISEEQKQATKTLADVKKAQSDAEHKLKELRREDETALGIRSDLEADASLLRLLQVNEVDVESAAARAIDTASEELRRIIDTVLRIRIESAEDTRAMDWLKGDGELLPPSPDVEATLAWLRTSGVRAWSGWEYIEQNTAAAERRAVVQRLPFVATGIVVANKDYDHVVDLTQHLETGPRLRSTITIVAADAITDANALIWTVIGPTSDAHFDRDAAAVELNRLEATGKKRDEEIRNHQEWQDELTRLRERLRSFQHSYPLGWFARHRQKFESAGAHLEEASNDVVRAENELAHLQSSLTDAHGLRDDCRARRATTDLHLQKVDDFIRLHGNHIDTWTHDLGEAQRNAEKHRANQKRLKEQADNAFGEAKEHEETARAASSAAAEDQREIPRLKYVDETHRQRVSGQIDSLRGDYQILLDDYENKVGSEALEQRARDKDDDADKEHREFLRVLGQYADLEAADVEAELSQLPTDLTAAVRAERADQDERSAWQRLGPLTRSRDARQGELDEANNTCETLLQTGTLPDVNLFKAPDRNHEEAERLSGEANQQLELAAEFDAEVNVLDGRLTKTVQETTALTKDAQRIQAMETNHQELFDRMQSNQEEERLSSKQTPKVKDADDLARQIAVVEKALLQQKTRHRELDEQRNLQTESVHAWSRDKRFAELTTSVSHRFETKRGDQLEVKAQFFITQLEDMILEIERKLEEADQHHDRVVNVVSSAVEDGLSLLRQVSRMSKLPESLPQAGKQYLLIDTKASDNPAERRARVGDMIDELLQTGNVGDGLALIQKAVRRVAVHTRVRVLHPDLQSTQRLSISAMRGKSGGERLTCAILLYCALVRLRQLNGGKKGSSVLILDNPIGTASRVSFLDLQREVAESMNVQLIYATGVKDLNAVGALENVIRLRNSRIDKRTGRRIVEFEGDGEWDGNIDAARVVFDAPPGSIVGLQDEEEEVVDREAADNAEYS